MFQLLCVLNAVVIVLFWYLRQRFGYSSFNDIITAKHIVTMNRSYWLYYFGTADSPAWPNAGCCKNLTCWIHTNSPIIHVLLKNNFWKSSSKQLVKNHALIYIILYYYNSWIFFNNLCDFAKLRLGKNFSYWVVRRIDQNYFCLFVNLLLK